MKLSEFTELAHGVFGPALARAFINETVLPGAEHLTARQALADGIPVRQVWTALCDEMNVPESQRWEVPPELRRR